MLSVVRAFLAVTLVAGVTAPAGAQPAPATRSLTLDEALTLAETTSERVTIAEAGVRRADGGRQLARAERLPQLSGAASYDRTLKSEFEGLFDAGPGGGAGGGDDVDFSELPFGQANVYRLGLSFSQLLYAGGRVRALEAQADIRRRSAGLGLAGARAETTLEVSEAYYDAALADRLVAIAEESYAQADRSLKVTEQQHAAGRLSEFELLRARVARDALQPEVVRARNAREVAHLRLKQLLDLPLEQALSLSADLDAPALSPPARFAARLVEAEAGAVAVDRLAVSQVAGEVGVAEQALAIVRAERRPAIVLRSDYGLVDYPDSVPTFGDWRQNWTVGVGLSLPIFDGGRIKANEVIASANAEQARATLRQAEELDRLDRASSRSDLAAALAEWDAAGSTIRQAERAYEIAELRYAEGLSTQLELSDARLQLARSLATRAAAARNLQVRRIRFALLPELPLGGGLAATAPSGAAPAPAASPARATTTAPAVPGATGTSGGR